MPKKLRKGRLITSLSIGLMILIVGGVMGIHATYHTVVMSSNVAKTRSNVTTPLEVTPPQSPNIDKSRYSLTDPTSIWVIVNKQRPLNPRTYTPTDLIVPAVIQRSNITSDERQIRQVTATALKQMFSAASSEGVTLNVQSGYRSHDFQVTLYNGYVRQQGQAVADSQSARPGYSEHQTGLAVDVGGNSQPNCNVATCFANTREGIWLAANAYKYGFIIRYPADKVAVTGYIYEPWHVRYIGTDLSVELHKDSVETLEEFFGLGSAPAYN